MASMCYICGKFADISFYDYEANAEVLRCYPCHNQIKKERGY
jgi:hypothetical protein